MDIKEINNLYIKIQRNYLEHQLRDKEIIEKAITFFNQYYNLVEHPFTPEDAEKLSNLNFSIKMDFLHWSACNPKSEDEINQFYRNTPFEFFKNLFKNMDIMHYEKIIGEQVLPELKKNNCKTVLDYGGGSGYQAILLNKLGFKVSFAEINKISVEWMRYLTKELNIDIEVIDLWEKEIENNYDMIILKDVLEHLPSVDHAKHIVNLVGKLSKKTKTLLIVPDKVDKEEDYLPMHSCYELQFKNG